MAAPAAAMPDENTVAEPPSSPPITSSSACALGASSRAYSIGPPAMNDDAGTMGVLSGASGVRGGRPAVTTKVSGLCREVVSSATDRP